MLETAAWNFDCKSRSISPAPPQGKTQFLMMGWLWVQCVGQDIEDLEYTPKPEFEGQFKVTNVTQEVMSFAITAQDGC